MLEHLISINQFDITSLERVMTLAASMEDEIGRIRRDLEGKRLACLFYEPSTRTRLSCEAAMLALGGQVVSTEAAGAFSSAAKGETLEDTIRVVGGYVHGIVLRHPETGSAARAAAVSKVPIINAGDGTGEHPTQTLTDLYTIMKEQGRTSGLTVTMVGDLKHGRTIHSLLRALAIYPDNHINLISPNELRLPKEIGEEVSPNSDLTEGENLGSVLWETDVLYVTRVQKERFQSGAEYERLKDCYRVDAMTMARLKPSAIVMHPLPRVGEIAPEVDNDRRAAYIRQAHNGFPVRMAILKISLDR